jgi:tagatose-6-phosphate ketose/aldose isomerase
VPSGSADTRAARPLGEPRSIAALLARPAGDQYRDGYAHTVREIHQQPETWIETAALMVRHRNDFARALRAAQVGPGLTGIVVLTGSGSSLYVGECVLHPLRRSLQAPVVAVPSGEVLTHLDSVMPAGRPGLMVSFARSGDSPESVAAVDEVLAARDTCRHLVITCNGLGRLAATHARTPEVLTLVLDARTCDRSLVMTSSFTNMVVAASLMASVDDADGYLRTTERLAVEATETIERSALLAEVAATSFSAAVFLGSGSRYGAAREAALKMLEMTDGRVSATAESFLGLRHGPMCGVHDDTLVVCFLSSDPVSRAYEIDLVRELNAKGLGRRLIVGHAVPPGIVRAHDAVLEWTAHAVADDSAAVTAVVAGQILALFACLGQGLRPDAPSNDNVINRVVEEFAIHRRYAPPPQPLG